MSRPDVPLGVQLASEMYDQVDVDGKARWTVAQIAAESGVHPTHIIYRYLDNG